MINGTNSCRCSSIDPFNKWRSLHVWWIRRSMWDWMTFCNSCRVACGEHDPIVLWFMVCTYEREYRFFSLRMFVLWHEQWPHLLYVKSWTNQFPGYVCVCVCGANSVSRTLQHAKKVASRIKQQADFIALFRRFYYVFRFSELTFLTLIPYVPWCVRESSLVCVQLFWVVPYKCE
jgi:hypothetical protein